VAGQGAQLYGLKAEHDVAPGDARRDQFLAKPGVGAVVLDPHLAVADVDVDDRAVDAPAAAPAHLDHLVVIVVPIHDGFGADVPVRRLVAGIFLDQTAYDLAIMA